MLKNKKLESKIKNSIFKNKDLEINTKDYNIFYSAGDLHIEFKAIKLKNEFYNSVNRIPDEQFIKICEVLGNDNINQISKKLESLNADEVMEGITIFMAAASVI